jgi:hypothetical protein
MRITPPLLDHPTCAYAVRDLRDLLGRVLPDTISIGPASDRGGIALAVDPKLAHALTIEHGLDRTQLTGRTPTDLLHAVYRFLEEVGYVFSVRGPVAPDGVAAWPAPFILAETPVLAERGIRQHINFPMDVSCYSLPDALEYVRNLARLKFNFLTFHCYDVCGWYHYDWQGIAVGEDPNTTLYYSEKHAVCPQPLVHLPGGARLPARGAQPDRGTPPHPGGADPPLRLVRIRRRDVSAAKRNVGARAVS